MDINKKVNLENYNLVFIRDVENFVSYGKAENDILEIILLNNKHSISDFEKAIQHAKELEQDNISENGDDWEYIKLHLDEFDFIELPNGYNIAMNNNIYI